MINEQKCIELANRFWAENEALKMSNDACCLYFLLLNQATFENIVAVSDESVMELLRTDSLEEIAKVRSELEERFLIVYKDYGDGAEYHFSKLKGIFFLYKVWDIFPVAKFPIVNDVFGVIKAHIDNFGFCTLPDNVLASFMGYTTKELESSLSLLEEHKLIETVPNERQREIKFGKLALSWNEE